MRRRAGLVVVLSLVGTLAVVPAAVAQTGLEIREVDAGEFPRVSLMLSLGAEAALEPGDVTVRENDEDVSVVAVEPLSESTVVVEVALVVDVSGSMKGEPLRAAIGAATDFVQGLPREVRVGLLTFASGTRVVRPLSGDHKGVLTGLRGLKASGETALYDGLARSVQMFRSGEAQRNVVLLSDGGDTVSKSTLNASVQAAQQRDVSVFTVGLKSGEFDANALRTIAQGTAGQYSTAETAELSAVYEGLATRLANQYLLTYESAAEPGSQLSIEVTAAGATATALTLAPNVRTLAPTGPPSPVIVQPGTPVLRGTWGLWVTAGLTFVAAFLIFLMLVGTGARVRREREAAARMRAVARPQEVFGAEQRPEATWMPLQMVEAAERVAVAGGFGEALERRIEQAGLPLRAGELLAVAVVAALGAAVLSALLFQNLILVLVITALAAAAPWALVSLKLRRRAQRLNDQLPEVLNIMASSLRAGHSFLQALDTVAKQIPEPAAGEFSRTIAEIRLGRPVEEALNAMAERVGSENFRWAVLAVNIQREVGGNLAEILDTVAQTVRERDELLRDVDVLTTEGRLSMYILTVIPILFAVYLFAARRDYVRILYTTRPGVIMLATSVSLLVLGYLWFKRIVKIDV